MIYFKYLLYYNL